MCLRLLTAWCAEHVLTGVGIAVDRVGTRLQSHAGAGFNLDVADACSGRRSLVALVALTIVLAISFPGTRAQRLAQILLSVPVAFLGNLVRVVAISLVAVSRGQADATGAFHEWSAYIVFAVETLIMLRISAIRQPQHTA